MSRSNEPTASTRRLLPRTGMVEECRSTDGSTKPGGCSSATCLCSRLHSPLVGSRTEGFGDTPDATGHLFPIPSTGLSLSVLRLDDGRIRRGGDEAERPGERAQARWRFPATAR
ncbi:unnamed protein product [Pleuronectes platessa]|uniref:Uncharacterized protein n=1 Tax=Pleuronectes platessa TaxID=8262 RepID=A0A9N7ZF34_PLEPL|nr:unnamed protein product [Pleuronectes platessa]